MVFCILDTAVPYESVCKAFDVLKRNNLTTRKQLLEAQKYEINKMLSSVGYRWANQKARYLKAFAENDIDLKTATRDEIVKKVKGVGYKLASMFLRNTRGEDHAVLDVHILRWIKEQIKTKCLHNESLYPSKSYDLSNVDVILKGLTYKEIEDLFRDMAKERGKTMTQLDIEIWNENRIGNRKHKTH
jgi:thermostable 8-oxoguanine DNA glycosylase